MEPPPLERFKQVSQQPLFPELPTFPHAEISAHMGPFPAEGRRGGELGESRPILESNCVFAFRDDSPRGAPSLSPFFQGDPWLTLFWRETHWAPAPLRKTAPWKQHFSFPTSIYLPQKPRTCFFSNFYSCEEVEGREMAVSGDSWVSDGGK